MSRVGSYRELRVYRQAFRQAMVIKAVVASFPAEERYDLVAQLRRSSRSVCANLAEAWPRRHYPRAFVAKLIDAEAEASETRVHLEIASACGYLTDAEFTALDQAYDQFLGQLVTMRTHPEDWRPGAGDRPVTRRSGNPPAPAPSSRAATRTKGRSGSPGAPVRSSRAATRTKSRGGSPGDDAPSGHPEARTKREGDSLPPNAPHP